MLSLGACMVAEPQQHSFYVELRPVNQKSVPSALAISGLSMEQLSVHGTPPREAMRLFAEWLDEQIPGEHPIFVAFNAPFDWMFVNDYFHRFLGRNPFGFAALDLKALYMGLTGASWSQTSMRSVAARYAKSNPLRHHALQDAQDQAVLFQHLLAEMASRYSNKQAGIPPATGGRS
jgi:DNA polymerase III epsilon subunit-like protein